MLGLIRRFTRQARLPLGVRRWSLLTATLAQLTVLRSGGVRVERLRPEAAKDWNEILEHGLDALRVVIAAHAAEVLAHVPNPGPPHEDEDQPIAAPYATMEPREPYVVAVILALADVDELLAWLAMAPRPCTPFRLWPSARVVDVEWFYGVLQTDLSRGPNGPRWGPAVEDLRQLVRLFGQPSILEVACMSSSRVLRLTTGLRPTDSAAAVYAKMAAAVPADVMLGVYCSLSASLASRSYRSTRLFGEHITKT